MMVTPISSYGTSSVYMSSTQTDSEYEDIKKELIKYGVSPTGIKSIDEDMLEQVKAEQAEKANPAQPAAKEITYDETSISIFKDMMDKMQINSTNDPEQDVLNVSNAIKEKLLNKNISDQERELYINYKLNLDQVISKTGIAVGIFVLTDEMRGATQLGEENKRLLKI